MKLYIYDIIYLHGILFYIHSERNFLKMQINKILCKF